MISCKALEQRKREIVLCLNQTLTNKCNERKKHAKTNTYPLKVVDDISRIAATKTWHGYADLLVVVFKVDADVFLEFLPPPQRSIHRVLKDNPTMEQTVFWDLLMGCNRAVSACDVYFQLCDFYPLCSGCYLRKEG